MYFLLYERHRRAELTGKGNRIVDSRGSEKEAGEQVSRDSVLQGEKSPEH